MSYLLFYYQQACSSAKPMQKINLATGAVDSEVFELMGRSLCLAARCARPFSRGISIEVDKRAPENQNTHTQRTKNSFYTTSKKQQSVSIWLRGNMFLFPENSRSYEPGRTTSLASNDRPFRNETWHTGAWCKLDRSHREGTLCNMPPVWWSH